MEEFDPSGNPEVQKCHTSTVGQLEWYILSVHMFGPRQSPATKAQVFLGLILPLHVE